MRLDGCVPSSLSLFKWEIEILSKILTQYQYQHKAQLRDKLLCSAALYFKNFPQIIQDSITLPQSLFKQRDHHRDSGRNFVQNSFKTQFLMIRNFIIFRIGHSYIQTLSYLVWRYLIAQLYWFSPHNEYIIKHLVCTLYELLGK